MRTTHLPEDSVTTLTEVEDTVLLLHPELLFGGPARIYHSRHHTNEELVETLEREMREENEWGKDSLVPRLTDVFRSRKKSVSLGTRLGKGYKWKISYVPLCPVSHSYKCSCGNSPEPLTVPVAIETFTTVTKQSTIAH